MGSGKSTIGKRLAKRLGWAFRDLDVCIEAAQGVSIAHIFDVQGEPAFREMETAGLAGQLNQAQTAQLVLALGGGAFAQPANRKLLAAHDTIWLDCPFELIRRRVGSDPLRPLARDPERFEQLFLQRKAAYAQARYRIEIAGDDPRPAVESILALPPASAWSTRS